MDTTIITTLLKTALNTLTSVLALVDKVPGLHEASKQLNAALSSITGALHILTLSN